MTNTLSRTSFRRLKVELERMADDTFEATDEAARWLRRPHPSLDGATPLECAKVNGGAQRVKDVLLSIRFGNVV